MTEFFVTPHVYTHTHTHTLIKFTEIICKAIKNIFKKKSQLCANVIEKFFFDC